MLLLFKDLQRQAFLIFQTIVDVSVAITFFLSHSTRGSTLCEHKYFFFLLLFAHKKTIKSVRF